MSRVMNNELMRKLNSPMRFTPVCACCEIGLNSTKNHFYQLKLAECEFQPSGDPFPEVHLLRRDGYVSVQTTYICDSCANKIIEDVDFKKKEDDE